MGGEFTQMGETARSNLGTANLDANDGKPLDWIYDTDGRVLAMAVWDKWELVGGKFKKVNGERTGYFAMLQRYSSKQP